MFAKRTRISDAPDVFGILFDALSMESFRASFIDFKINVLVQKFWI